MSKRMIDYKVEEGKITSIDGYDVGGGALTGDALMNITKDSATITRTLDTDGKVKLENLESIKSIKKTLYTELELKEYQIGDIVDGININTGSGKPISAIPPSIQYAKGIVFLGIAFLASANVVSFKYMCIKGGTLSVQDHLSATVECWYI